MSWVSVRYIIDDVPAAMRFSTTLLGFTVEQDASPAFASVVRDGVRLLLSGDGSSGKRPLPDGRDRNRAAGTESTWRWPICLRKWRGCVRPAFRSARTRS